MIPDTCNLVLDELPLSILPCYRSPNVKVWTWLDYYHLEIESFELGMDILEKGFGFYTCMNKLEIGCETVDIRSMF